MGQTGEKRRCWFESSRGSGEIYAYFHSNGRKHDPTSCQLRSVLIHEVERQIDTIYQRITLTAEQRREIEATMLDELAAQLGNGQFYSRDLPAIDEPLARVAERYLRRRSA